MAAPHPVGFDAGCGDKQSFEIVAGVAQALVQPVLEVAAYMLGVEDELPHPSPPPPATIDDVIERSSLANEDKAALRAMVEAALLLHPGRDQLTVRDTRKEGSHKPG